MDYFHIIVDFPHKAHTSVNRKVYPTLSLRQGHNIDPAREVRTHEVRESEREGEGGRSNRPCMFEIEGVGQVPGMSLERV